jgi:hypothetical protein
MSPGFSEASKLLVGLVGALFWPGQAQANCAMSWVPAYEIRGSADALQTGLGDGLTAGRALSRIALQFWVPLEGVLTLDKRVSDADVRSLITLARQSKLQVLLCVFNAYTDVGGSGFSWERAKKTFVNNREAFVRQIATEMEKFGLDGVEVDIESERDGLTSQDRSDFAAFVLALAEELHSRGKIITLSSFPGRWLGPNNTWWSDWAKVVDGVQSMGYADVGKVGTQDWDSYLDQVLLWVNAGGDPKKFLNGVSVYSKQWKGAQALENLSALSNVAEATGSGVAVWELSRKAHPEALDPGWNSSANWNWIGKIKDSRSP